MCNRVGGSWGDRARGGFWRQVVFLASGPEEPKHCAIYPVEGFGPLERPRVLGGGGCTHQQ